MRAIVARCSASRSATRRPTAPRPFATPSRRCIPGATRNHVEVTNGGAEANFVCSWHLVEPGDEVVVMVPNYMQVWGLARAFAGAASVREWPLRQADDQRWDVDLALLERLVTPRTKALFICNPNNPTGARLTTGQLDDICRVAGRHGAWVLSDEIYRGAELDGRDTPSIWGRYDRAIVTGRPVEGVRTPGAEDRLAGCAAGADRDTLGLPRLHHNRPGHPQRSAGGACAPAGAAGADPREDPRHPPRELSPHPAVARRPQGDIQLRARRRPAPSCSCGTGRTVNSTDLTTELRQRYSTLIVPGDQFGLDRFLRIGYGAEEHVLREGLRRLELALAAHAG